MILFDKDFKEILGSQLISVIGGLIVGTLLAIYTDKLLLIPGMIILLPGFLEMRGNISGSMASRLSSGLFLKIVNPNKTNTKIIIGNFIASFIQVIAVSLVLGIIAFGFNNIIFHISTTKIIFIPLIAGILANLIEIPLTIIVTFYLFKKGHDPNNIMGPFLTSTGDITSVLAILVTLFLL